MSKTTILVATPPNGTTPDTNNSVVLVPRGAPQDDGPQMASARTAVNLVMLVGLFLVATRGATPRSQSQLVLLPSSQVRSTIVGTTASDAVFNALGEQPSPPVAGTLALDAQPNGVSAVAPFGTAPPALTITGVPFATVKGVFVKADVLAGARGVWQGHWSIDGVTWHAFTSAATVDISAQTGLMLNFAVGNASLNNVWIAQGSGTIALTIAQMPAINQGFLVQHGTSSARYTAAVVIGTTVITAEPVVWPFVTGDAVALLASFPSDVEIDGNDVLFSGTGCQSIEFTCTERPVVKRVRYSSANGVIVGSAIGSDIACRGALIEDCDLDQHNGSATTYFQSNERGVTKRVTSRNSGFGSALFDYYGSGLEDCWAVGTTVGGHQIQKVIDGGGTFGCKGCYVKGGGALDIQGNALRIAESTDTTVTNHFIDGCDTGLAESATDTHVQGLTVNRATTNGILVDVTSSGLTIDGYRSDQCGLALRNNGPAQITNMTVRRPVVSAIQANANLSITGLMEKIVTGDLDVNKVVNNVTAGTFKLVQATITSTVANATIFQAGGVGTILRHRDVDITLSVGNNQTGYFLLNGSVSYLTGVVVTGTGFGLYVRSGATAYVDETCDFSGCTTPVTVEAGGKLYGSFKGAGTPEGAVIASPSSTYADQTNGEQYIKHTGDGNVGWKLVTHA